MTDKTFKTSKCEMGISPVTMVDFLGITNIGGNVWKHSIFDKK